MFKALIIDDSKFSRSFLKLKLLEEEQIFNADTIKEANNGEEALELLKTQDFDLIISDFNMPKMNGLEFLESLRATEKTKQTKVVILSSMIMPETKKALEALNVSLIVQKPIKQHIIKNVIIKIAIEENAKKTWQKHFASKERRDLVQWLVEDFFYKNLDFQDQIGKDLDDAKICASFEKTINQTINNQEESALLARYVKNEYKDTIFRVLAELFLFEFGNNDKNAKSFLAQYTGGVKMIDNIKYKIPSIIGADNVAISQNDLGIVASAYCKSQQEIKQIAKNLKETEQTLKEQKQDLKDLIAQDNIEAMIEKEEHIKTTESQKQQILATLKAKETSNHSFKERFEETICAVAKVLQSKKERFS